MYPKHLLRQTITLHTGGEPDDYGQVTGGTSADHPARVEFVNKTTGIGTGSDTQLVVITARVWLAPDVDVEEHAKLVYDGGTYRVEKIIKVPDATGRNRLLELECSEWAR